jgi:extracellular factor (EF) 3-hydroxypalmitic acid methyl ester biosynthesis protein
MKVAYLGGTSMHNANSHSSGDRNGRVICRSNQGNELSGTLLGLKRHQASFELYNPPDVLQMSEVLGEFKIIFDDRAVYSGRAVISSLVHAGTTLVCEAALDEACLDVRALCAASDPRRLQAGFEEFIRDWGKTYRILPEMKTLVADIHSFLSDLRLWLEQVELGIRSTPTGDRKELEHRALTELHKPIVPALNGLFEKFEVVASRVEPDDKPAHRVFVRRQIHPLVFCAPFAYRTYHKPLGYAGDYEMVNMILRDPFEGGSLFAKALNSWFISQPPAEAHRNRIKHLTKQLVQETARVAAAGRAARIYNLGCGPAAEVQRFLAEHDISNHADFSLLDFNNETIAYATSVLQEAKTRHQRSTRINMIKKSVGQILKGRGRSTATAPESKYDYIYCAGLFDYLADQHCKQLMNIFYDMLAPGGLLMATNVDASNPIQQMLDYVLDWNLIYRRGARLREAAPDAAHPDDLSVSADVTSVNIYLEVRKPAA